MKPYCSKCFTQEPDPVEADTGDLIYWFKVCDEEDYDVITIGIDDDGQVTDIYVGIADKSFEYDDTYKLLCPECAVDESGLLGEEIE